MSSTAFPANDPTPADRSRHSDRQEPAAAMNPPFDLVIKNVRLVRPNAKSVDLEDIGITERLQRGRASPGFDGGRLSPVQDFGSHHFMRAVARCMAAN